MTKIIILNLWHHKLRSNFHSTARFMKGRFPWTKEFFWNLEVYSSNYIKLFKGFFKKKKSKSIVYRIERNGQSSSLYVFTGRTSSFYPNTFFGSRCFFQTINLLDLSIRHINGSSIKPVPNETEFIWIKTLILLT